MAWKKEQEESMELKIRVFKIHFEKYYIRWVGEWRTTDRHLFCNQYEIQLEEMENMKKVKSNYINVAFNEASADDQKSMMETVSYFTGRSTRSGRLVVDPEPDSHGNMVMTHGCDFCECGGKYWVNDTCVCCGTFWSKVKINMNEDDVSEGPVSWVVGNLVGSV